MKLTPYTIGLVFLASLATPALAFQPVSGPSPTGLPLFAQTYGDSVSGKSPFKGFYAGEDFSFMGGSGLRGQKAGTQFFGYKHTFKNKIFADIQTRSGYQPLLGGGSTLGYDFSSVRLKTGYSFGRFRPFVASSFGVAAPERLDALTFAPFGSSPAGLNSAAAGTRSFATVSAGFDYKITNNLSFSAAVTVGTNNVNSGPRW